MIDPSSSQPPGDRFPTTHWGKVVMAGDPAEPGARAALAELCQAYWYPLYAFVRRMGFAPEESADLVQGTIAVLLARGGLTTLTPERGRFRSFLKAVCVHHVADCRDRDRAAKRGSGRQPITIDGCEAEGRYGAEPTHDLTAQRPFDRRWALGVLEHAVNRLEAEMAACGKAALCSRVLPALTDGRGAISYDEVGIELGLTPGAVKTAASRMRRRYGEILREEVARTVADPGEVEDEINALFAALSL